MIQPSIKEEIGEIVTEPVQVKDEVLGCTVCLPVQGIKEETSEVEVSNPIPEVKTEEVVQRIEHFLILQNDSLQGTQQITNSSDCTQCIPTYKPASSQPIPEFVFKIDDFWPRSDITDLEPSVKSHY